MNILIDIIHPGDVHFFKFAIKELKKRGHNMAVTARKKDVTIDLLKNLEIPFTCISTIGKGRIGLLYELLVRDYRLFKFCRRFKPDVLTGVSGISVSHVGTLLGRYSVIWDDTEHQKYIHLLTWPMATMICSPDCYTKPAGEKHRLYPGLHELAYLHPKRFNPDIEIVKSAGLNVNEKYCIIRTVSWGASHDVGQFGLAEDKKMQLVEKIAQHARPYITSEAPLPPILRPYQLNIPVHMFHHVLGFASLCVTEGGTVASEAAVLGVPTVYINTQKMGYINMLEEYGLIKQANDTAHVLQLSLKWLKDESSLDKCREVRKKMLSDRMDVTEYIVETIEHCKV